MGCAWSNKIRTRGERGQVAKKCTEPQSSLDPVNRRASHRRRTEIPWCWKCRKHYRPFCPWTTHTSSVSNIIVPDSTPSSPSPCQCHHVDQASAISPWTNAVASLHSTLHFGLSSLIPLQSSLSSKKYLLTIHQITCFPFKVCPAGWACSPCSWSWLVRPYKVQPPHRHWAPPSLNWWAPTALTSLQTQKHTCFFSHLRTYTHALPAAFKDLALFILHGWLLVPLQYKCHLMWEASPECLI